MKNVIITFLFITLWVSEGHAQSTNEVNINTTAESISQELCECMNSMFNEFHPKLIVLLTEMMDLGEEKAQENFVTYLATATSEDTDKINEDIAKMENIEILLEERCGELKKRIEKNKGEELKNAVITAISKKQECRLVWMMLRSTLGEKP
jgi:hypothetical protein